ncbi:MAG: ribonuclease P protein component [Alphaproteobacteria bacterium]
MAGKSYPPEATLGSSPRLLKVEQLRHRPDFLRCARAMRHVTASLTLETAPTPLEFARPSVVRVGFTATKKGVGGAVDRNRAKRRLRAAAQAQLPLYAVAGNDYVLVARAGTLTSPFADLLADLGTALNALREKTAYKDES